VKDRTIATQAQIDDYVEDVTEPRRRDVRAKSVRRSALEEAEDVRSLVARRQINAADDPSERFSSEDFEAGANRLPRRVTIIRRT
jgi:hypothetical protein